MAKMVKSSGQYTAPDGKAVAYEFEFEQFDSLQDAIAVLGEPEALKTIQRMVKVDANNTTREKAKVANGHSTRVVQTEEQKAKAKVQRQSDKALLDAIKAKGVTSLSDLEALL